MDKSKAYDVLGLSPTAGEAEIKAAYKTLAQKYSMDTYEAGPLGDDAKEKMDEINLAFDTLMSYLRTGTDAQQPLYKQSQSGKNSNYPTIRQMINTGRIDEALAELAKVTAGSSNAEWNFLMGSAYYYKGWLDEALRYFQTAVSLAPGNREYEAALRNLQNASNGGMNGSPYTQRDVNAQAMNCACNTCTLMCCMDACCGAGRGC